MGRRARVAAERPAHRFDHPQRSLPDRTLTSVAVTGENLASTSFEFPPGITPPGMVISSLAIQPDGLGATFDLTIDPAVVGSFTLVATGASGASSGFPTDGNTFRVLGPDGDEDNDKLTNAEEEPLGTDPFDPDRDGDGVIDGLEVILGTDPLLAGSLPPPLAFGDVAFTAGKDPDSPIGKFPWDGPG